MKDKMQRLRVLVPVLLVCLPLAAGCDSLRDAAGLAIDVAIDPTNQIHFKQHIWWDAGRIYFTLLDLRAQNYQTIQGIQRSSVDYYSSLRNLYRQMRAEQISNGRPIRQDLPDF